MTQAVILNKFIDFIQITSVRTLHQIYRDRFTLLKQALVNDPDPHNHSMLACAGDADSVRAFLNTLQSTQPDLYGSHPYDESTLTDFYATTLRDSLTTPSSTMQLALETGISNLDTLNQFQKEHEANTRSVLKALSHGHCHGFSITLSCMAAIGKLDWWMHCLAHINNWDGSADALDAELFIPGSSDPNAPVTLRYIFNLALNHIIYYQVHHNKGIRSFNANMTDQHLSLRPQQQYLEVNNDAGGVEIVRQHRALIGSFSESDLSVILDQLQSQLKKSIILIHNIGHTISIFSINDTWCLYDPNFNHSDLDTLIERFNEKSTLIHRLWEILTTQSISIEIASLNDTDNLDCYYDKLLTQIPPRLLRDETLTLSCRVDNFLAATVIKMASKITPHGAELRKAIAEAIAFDYSNSHNLILTLCVHDPALLPALFKLFQLEPYGNKIKKAFAAQLSKVFPSGRNVLNYLSHFHPDYCDLLFTEALNETHGHQLKNAIAASLCTFDSNRGNALFNLIDNQNAFANLLRLASHPTYGCKIRNYIALNLRMSMPSGLTLLQYILQKQPHTLASIFKLVTHADTRAMMRQCIAQALLSPHPISHQKTFLHIIRSAPESIKYLLNMIDDKKSGFAIVSAITQIITDPMLPISWLHEFISHVCDPNVLTQFFQLADRQDLHGEPIRHAFSCILSEKHLSQRTTFHFLLSRAPAVAKPLLHSLLIATDDAAFPVVLMNIIKTLTTTSGFEGQSDWDYLSARLSPSEKNEFMHALCESVTALDEEQLRTTHVMILQLNQEQTRNAYSQSHGRLFQLPSYEKQLWRRLKESIRHAKAKQAIQLDAIAIDLAAKN